MGVLLGTATLPKLFGSSVFVCMIGQAAASAFLNQVGLTKEAAMRSFFRRLSYCILIFAASVILTLDTPLANARGGVIVRFAQFESLQSNTSTSRAGFSVDGGDATISRPRKILFVLFYLWMGIQNLISVSVMWARCADVFPAASASRVFGILSAAATCGQLLGAVTVQLLSWTVHGPMPIWIQVLLLSVSASAMYATSLLVSYLKPCQAPPACPDKLTVDLIPDLESSGLVKSPMLPNTLERRSSTGIAISLPNSPKSVHAEHSPGVFGVPTSSLTPRLSGKAGALPRTLAAPSLQKEERGRVSTELRREERLVRSASWDGSRYIRSPAKSRKGALDVNSTLIPPSIDPQTLVSKTLPWLRQSIDAFVLIARSTTLLHLSAHLVCSYIISSLLYFTRSHIFAASLSSSGSRLRWFSAGNALSALIILMLQLFATGSAIKHAGAAVALVSVPLTCIFATALLALHPIPVVLVFSETARKVVSYSLAKPAREMLFTQLSSEVKYKSKLVLDTVVQRGGDALGATIFTLLRALFLKLLCFQ